MKSAQQILAETRELFAGTHWIKGNMRQRVGGKERYCLIGGLRQVAAGDAREMPTGAAYGEALAALVEVAHGADEAAQLKAAAEGEYFEYLEDPLIGFNDSPGTTLKEVLAALDAAEKLLPTAA